MNVLVIHQFLWSHYKAGIFKELELLCQNEENCNLKIIQMATYEKSRIELGKADRQIHDYNYELLFDDVYENTSIKERFFKTISIIKKYKPDVVNLPGYYEPAMILVHFWLKLFTKIKVILSIDSTEGDNPNHFLKEKLKRFIIKNADGFFCYGSMSAQYMLKLGAKPEEILMKRNSVNNGIVKNLFTKEQETKTINSLDSRKYWFIYIGRFLDIKNLPLLIDSFNSLKKNEDWGLCLLGGGQEMTTIENLTKSNSSIQLLPAQDWKEIPKFLANSHVLVLPSKSEPWGLVVNEALVCQRPVIVSNKCGSSFDLVKPNKNGFIFDPFSKEELTKHMQFFVDNPIKIKEFGENSSAIIKDFSPQNVAKEMFNGFKKIVY